MAQHHTAMLHLLYRVMAPCAVYRGVAITNCNGCYAAFGKTWQSLQQAKDAIDESYILISASIKKSKIKPDFNGGT